jgi:cytochrome P450
MTATLPTYEIFTPEAGDDSLSILRRISAESPVSWLPEVDAYLITRHADIARTLKDPEFTVANATKIFSTLSEADQATLAPVRASLDLWMGGVVDPASHQRMQKLLKRYFTPATMNRLRPRVRELSNELLDAVAAQGRMDVVSDFAYPLPAGIIAEMLGMPAGDRDRLPVWSRDITAFFMHTTMDRLLAGQSSILEMQDYLRGIVGSRRANPGDDLISVFVAAEREGLVNEDEIVANCVLLLFAGHETTANVITNGLNLLLTNPDQLALLTAQPELMPSAVEEMLRCGGPATTVVRECLEPVTIAGHEFAPGDHIYLALYSANHDPEVFADPMRFDITRQNIRHLAFGMGAYYCLGAALARVETSEAFRVLLSRHPGIQMDGEAVVTRQLPLSQRFDTFPVRL